MKVSEEIKNLQREKQVLINDFIKLKAENNKTYFQLQEKISDNEKLKKDLLKLEAENKNLKKMMEKFQSNIKSESDEDKENEEFEVEKLLKHRGRKGRREFLVRWKNFSRSDDSWEKMENLRCPAVLQKYLKENKL